MKTFLCRIFVWAFFLIMPILVCFSIWGVRPNVSNNPSICHKLYVSSQKVKNDIKIAAIGSSITLNNLYSPTIVAELDSCFYNFACAGLNMSFIRFMAEFYMERFHYKALIVASGIEDFASNQSFTFPAPWEFDMMYKKHYYLLSLVSSPFKSMLPLAPEICTDPEDMHNQNYDNWGGAYLHINKRNAKKEHWERTYKPMNKENGYAELEKLCKMLKRHQAALIFAISPCKSNFICNEEATKDYHTHLQKCQSILQKYGYPLYDFSQEPCFNENHFADAVHMNEEGAKLLTKLLCEQIKSSFRTDFTSPKP